MKADHPFVIIPVKNEADNIHAQVTALLSAGYSVVVSDGDSAGGTIAHIVPAEYLHCIARPLGHAEGIGPAIMRGLVYAYNHGAQRFVVMDAQSHRPIDVPALLACRADVVIGSRFMRHSWYEGRPVRQLMSRLASLMCSLKTGIWISDWTSGFRVYSRRAVTRLMGCGFQTAMHSWQIEALAACLMPAFDEEGHRKDLTHVSVPIDYCPGKSSFDLGVALDAIHVWVELSWLSE